MNNRVHLSQLQRLLSIILFSCFISLHAQNEKSKWYFGTHVGLDFMTTPPTVLTNGAITSNWGCASIADAAGNLLFYTDGDTIWNQAHVPMANGIGLTGYHSTQSSIIAKQPGNSNLFYVFTVGCCGTGTFAYSIVDMNLAAGMGSVTVKNNSLSINATEKLASVKHCNGKDMWMIIHDYNSTNFKSFLFTASGVNTTPVISSIGSIHQSGYASYAGVIKVSPNGKKLGAVSTPTLELFDFDNATGVISNWQFLAFNLFPSVGGCEFSSDGTKFYYSVSSNNGTTGCSGSVYQKDLCSGNTSTVFSSAVCLGQIQAASDGKLYVARPTSGPGSYLGIINNPNVLGSACNYVDLGIQVAPPYTNIHSLPNFVTDLNYLNKVPFTYSINCTTVSFSSPIQIFSTTCTGANNPSITLSWDFGEPGSGAANSSILANPVHAYSNTGTYTVSLIQHNPCSDDTIKQAITLTTPGPVVTVQGKDTICKGESYIYTVSGGIAYLWSTGSNSPSVVLNPTQTTVYSASALLNGCTLSKSFTVTVDLCSSIQYFKAEIPSSMLFTIYPNPCGDILHIEFEKNKTITNVEVQIINSTGQIVKEEKIATNATINIYDLPSGAYILNLKTDRYYHSNRFVLIR
jgi:PKD repeat protein